MRLIPVKDVEVQTWKWLHCPPDPQHSLDSNSVLVQSLSNPERPWQSLTAWSYVLLPGQVPTVSHSKDPSELYLQQRTPAWNVFSSYEPGKSSDNPGISPPVPVSEWHPSST